MMQPECRTSTVSSLAFSSAGHVTGNSTRPPSRYHWPGSAGPAEGIRISFDDSATGPASLAARRVTTR